MLELRTSAWYGERPLHLALPPEWEVEQHWPATTAPLSDEQIGAALADPIGRPPLREFARGARRPVVIVDDLTRPTPAERVLPHLLRELEAAGCEPERTTMILATGSHQRIPADAPRRKVGDEAARRCRLLVHDGFGRAVTVGRTSYGTVVRVNPHVVASDLVLGVGGVYPQHSTGFGGGAKLAIGVLGKSSIARLHYRHEGMQGRYVVENDFRRDLAEVARLVRLSWTVNVHVDAERRPVRVVCGDHDAFYPDEVEFAMRTFRAPRPGNADVVISNAYPADVSLTFVRSKGMIPLDHAAPAASRILIAGCPEGEGLHGVFPFVGGPRYARQRHVARLIRHRPADAAVRIARRARRLRSRRPPPLPQTRRQVSLFVTEGRPGRLPEQIPEMRAFYDWDEVVERVAAEQDRGRPLRVAVYPCAPLQVLTA